jgi:hypothetical protein
MGSYGVPWRSNAVQLVGILAKIQLSYPDSQALWLSDVPIVDGTLNDAWGGAIGGTGAATANERLASIGVASAILTTEINLSSISGGELAIVIRDVPYSHFTSGLYTWGTMMELFTKYSAPGSAVSIFQYGKAGGTQETRTVSSVPVPIIKGYVSGVTDFTPTTFTLRISFDYAQVMGTCPVWTVGGDGNGTWPYEVAEQRTSHADPTGAAGLDAVQL